MSVNNGSVKDVSDAFEVMGADRLAHYLAANEREWAPAGDLPSLESPGDGNLTNADSERDESPEFPVECLPPIMAEMVNAAANALRVPTSLPGVCSLGIVSASLGKGL